MRLVHHLPVENSSRWISTIQCTCGRLVHVHISLYRWLAEIGSEFSTPRCDCGEVLLTKYHSAPQPCA